jgi:hypothetical protein
VLSKPITPKSMNVLGHGLALPLNRQSLDLATGPLINFGGASAAYSLRDLNGRNPRIVRVRRASDNHERDFYKDGINSGELTNWVNSQIVPPLDIGVLTPEGRIPVPEGGTSIGIPAAAYSLRNLSTTYTGNVVDVRRSSNNAEESFTAAEVADGTLTDWVNTNFNVKTYDFSSGAGGLAFTSNMTLEGGESIAGVDDALKMSVVSTGGNDVHRCYQNLSALGSGSSLRITFKAYRPSSNVNSGKLGFSFASGFLSSNIEEQFFSADDTWEDFTFDANSGTSTRFYVQLSSTDGIGSLKSIFNGTTGDHVYIKDLKIDVVNSSGFVSQWYDQSGNDNHATQGTDASQPMIVDGGSLVTGGIDFDGVDDFLTNSANIFAQTFSVFTVQTSDTDETVGVSFSREYFTPNQRITISSDTRTVTKRLANYAPDATDRFINRVSKQSANTEEFITLISDGSNMAAWLDGVSLGAVTSTATPSSPNHGFRIGKQDTGPIYHSGPIQELIIYPSDQSANRTAIEANIGETYGITGIPAYDNTVDGFVETWYDQSGNGNDATQSVATKQPKIVDGGSLVSGGLDFDGSSSAMDIDGLALESTEYYMTAVIDLDVVSSGYLKTIFDSTDGNNAGAALAYANTGSQLTPFMFDGNDVSVNVFVGGANLTTSKTLVGCQFKSGASESHINGGVNSTLSNTWTSAGTNTFTKSTIGYDQTTANRNLNGKLAELIVYESDQSANRVAIETNINDHYNIY